MCRIELVGGRVGAGVGAGGRVRRRVRVGTGVGVVSRVGAGSRDALVSRVGRVGAARSFGRDGAGRRVRPVDRSFGCRVKGLSFGG